MTTNKTEVSRRLGKRPQHALRGAGAETKHDTSGHIFYVNYQNWIWGFPEMGVPLVIIHL